MPEINSGSSIIGCMYSMTERVVTLMKQDCCLHEISIPLHHDFTEKNLEQRQ